MASQDVFDSTYWNRRPLLVRNGPKPHAAANAWSTKAKSIISAFRGSGFGSAWFRSSDEHASFFMHEFFRKSTAPRARRRSTRWTWCAVPCRHVCNAPESDDQTYLFDRDDCLLAGAAAGGGRSRCRASQRTTTTSGTSVGPRPRSRRRPPVGHQLPSAHERVQAAPSLAVKRWFGGAGQGWHWRTFTMGMLLFWLRSAPRSAVGRRGGALYARGGGPGRARAAGGGRPAVRRGSARTIALGEGGALGRRCGAGSTRSSAGTKPSARGGRSHRQLGSRTCDRRQHRDEVEGDLVMHTGERGVAGLAPSAHRPS